MPRNLSFSDRMIDKLDNALKTLTPGAVGAGQPSPGKTQLAPELSDDERRHFAGLMRINHTGEVCAQALYQGQATTARLPQVRESMQQAADEELDHLAWCEERVNELGGHTSLLNPVFYALSFALGAGAGVIGDRWSLGFVAATEDQVSGHLRDHLEQIGERDPRSHAILAQMLEDEERHSHNAIAAGGQVFPEPVKRVMTMISKVMTQSAYRL